MPDDYKVGYGKPPAHSRFKPGQSGNPKGRPRKAGPSAERILSILDEPVRVRKGNTIRKMSPFEVTVRQIVGKALKGDIKAAVEFVKMCERYKVVVTDAPMPTSGVVEVPAHVPWDEATKLIETEGVPSKWIRRPPRSDR